MFHSIQIKHISYHRCIFSLSVKCITCTHYDWYAKPLLTNNLSSANKKFHWPQPNEFGGGYTAITFSICLSICPSICRRHGFWSVTQVCFEVSISNFICIFLVAMGRSLLIFSYVTFKMVAWRPSWVFRFPDSNFCLALNIKSKLQ